MEKKILGEPTFWSPNGTCASLDIDELSEDQFNELNVSNFSEKDRKSFDDVINFALVNAPFPVAARVYGGPAKAKGRYLHTRNYPNAETAARRLAIKPEWNSCEFSATVEIPAGITIAYGKPKNGRDTQIFVPDEYVSKLKIFGPNTIQDTSVLGNKSTHF